MDRIEKNIRENVQLNVQELRTHFKQRSLRIGKKKYLIKEKKLKLREKTKDLLQDVDLKKEALDRKEKQWEEE